jgi:predicted dehydrogenase
MREEIKVGFYGTGGIAKKTHIPILQDIPGVRIAAICDADESILEDVGNSFAVASGNRYRDGMEMVEKEDLDVLFSCVPAFVRKDVETTAVAKGVHIFSEKPQAIDMETALRIDTAIRDAGVISTVGFRERHRPLFTEIREFLSDKDVIHAQVTMPRPDSWSKAWLQDEDLSGGFLLEWGCHALDYTRYMTSQNVATAQLFTFRPEGSKESLSFSVNFQFGNGGTMHISFINFLADGPVSKGRQDVPLFSYYYIGGRVDVYRGGGKKWSYELNGELVREEEFDPWEAHDRVFMDAVRTGDRRGIRNDYSDGLKTIGPLLAARESVAKGGIPIDMETFLKG